MVGLLSPDELSLFCPCTSSGSFTPAEALKGQPWKSQTSVNAERELRFLVHTLGATCSPQVWGELVEWASLGLVE